MTTPGMRETCAAARVAKAALAHEAEMAVVGVHAGSAPGAQDGVLVRRNVDIQNLEPQEVRAGRLGGHPHPDAGGWDVGA